MWFQNRESTLLSEMHRNKRTTPTKVSLLSLKHTLFTFFSKILRQYVKQLNRVELNLKLGDTRGSLKFKHHFKQNFCDEPSR